MSNQVPLMGQFSVGTSAAALSGSAIPCVLVRFKALSSNSGKIYLGTTSSVAAGSGFELNAGDDTGWVPTDDVARFFGIATVAAQGLCYWIQK